MTILTTDLYSIPVVAVELSIAMIVQRKVAVDTVHPLNNFAGFLVDLVFQMNISKVYCFRETLWIAKPNNLTVFIEEITLSVPFEYGFEDPTMAVIIGKLGMFQFRIQLAQLS